MKKDKIVMTVFAGLLLGNLMAPTAGMPIDFGKLADKLAKPVKESTKLYDELKKDVENLKEDKDKLEKDIDKIKAIPEELEATINKIKETLTGVKANLVTTAKHVKETADDVGKLEDIYDMIKKLF